MLIGQLLGLIGIALLVLVFQVNNRRTLLRLQITSCLVWAAYYFFVGAFTGGGLIMIGALRSYLFDKYRRHEWILGAMIVTFGIATLITWHDWTSIMALIAMTIATIAMWQKNPRHIRTISLFVTPFWLTYNILNGSYLGAVADLVTFSSIVIGIVRFDIMPAYLNRRTPEIQVAETKL